MQTSRPFMERLASGTTAHGKQARARARARAGRQEGVQVVGLRGSLNPVPFLSSGAGTLVEAIPDYVEQAHAQIAALGGVEPHAAYGIVAEELALYSASLDLLVVGSRSYGPLGRHIHGSTSQRLARTARCPLLVLTRGVPAGRTVNPAENGQESVAAGTV